MAGMTSAALAAFETTRDAVTEIDNDVSYLFTLVSDMLHKSTTDGLVQQMAVQDFIKDSNEVLQANARASTDSFKSIQELQSEGLARITVLELNQQKIHERLSALEGLMTQISHLALAAHPPADAAPTDEYESSTISTDTVEDEGAYSPSASD